MAALGQDNSGKAGLEPVDSGMAVPGRSGYCYRLTDSFPADLKLPGPAQTLHNLLHNHLHNLQLPTRLLQDPRYANRFLKNHSAVLKHHHQKYHHHQKPGQNLLFPVLFLLPLLHLRHQRNHLPLQGVLPAKEHFPPSSNSQILLLFLLLPEPDLSALQLFHFLQEEQAFLQPLLQQVRPFLPVHF